MGAYDDDDEEEAASSHPAPSGPGLVRSAAPVLMNVPPTPPPAPVQINKTVLAMAPSAVLKRKAAAAAAPRRPPQQLLPAQRKVETAVAQGPAQEDMLEAFLGEIEELGE